MSDNSEKELKNVKNNRVVKLICLITIIVGVGVLIVLFFNGTLMLNKEKRLERELTNTGKKFYTKFYYDRITSDKKEKQIKTELENFKSIGIKVNLVSLKKYSYDFNKKSIDLLEKNKCDITKTSVTIYPKAPYGKNDFNIKASLDCK